MASGKGVAILIHDGYQDLQFWHPLLRLREAGTPVTVIGVDPERTYYSVLEYPVIPDAGIGASDARGFAAVVVPGGPAAGAIAAEPRMASFLRDAAAAGALLAGIAEGARAIADAGAPDGRRVTAASTNELPAFCRELVKGLGLGT